MLPLPRSLVLGTAGHIDHGKTALVRALTGVDTDRLAEEKQRGITIELGFARYAPEDGDGIAFGVVDVPGHEGFVKTMVAGATGMDVVLLVVAADEGVMPQTREHLAIVALLGVAEMVVALSKADMVDAEWMELVREEVADLLAGTPYEDAEVVPTSVETGDGLPTLSQALVRCGSRARRRADDDLFRLPVDRVFAVEGAGTVATGTLWSGSLTRGGSVRILPGGGQARIRTLQVHGEQVETAVAGQRTAVALTGASVRRGLIARGDVLVSDPSWRPSMMLTVELACLPETGWRVEAGQRVRVHLGTVEVMARVALFGADEIVPGEAALAQLRLEAQVVARAGDRLVVRSYSPVTTIAGGVVLEPVPPKRKRLAEADRLALAGLARGGQDAVKGAVALAGWNGLDKSDLGVLAGRTGGPFLDSANSSAPASAAGPAPTSAAGPTPATAAGPTPATATGSAPTSAAGSAPASTAVPPPDPPTPAWSWDGALFAPEIVADGESRILAATAGHHRRRSLEAGAPLDVLRQSLPARSRPRLADGLATRLASAGRLIVTGGIARLPDFKAALSPDEAALAERLTVLLRDAGLQGPTTAEAAAQASDHPRTAAVLDFLAAKGRVRLLGDSYWTATETLADAAARVARQLGGREGLGPADFREVLPVTRKHLIPVLAHFDATGLTMREAAGRRVAKTPPDATPPDAAG